ncbi:uncharacterized protein MONBRDRAFT_9808 [Monosiga brevicollis MX1]|uniref:Peptidase M12B domain-containing protein n=1 Tax=Monosiga brevicollis TaxID=81824 RepID=A9V4A6_MONBE|nr:uncharacterized protein MONBRDRAFT_9808 [Monosiga brevicollis MX1]EDQ87582.1 predicted protein [Monosiga brevicollis MX1]|eukprot:XP_001747502.1 hypothetical protein [Monosiga brevicollis MX1]
MAPWRMVISVVLMASFVAAHDADWWAPVKVEMAGSNELHLQVDGFAAPLRLGPSSVVRPGLVVWHHTDMGVKRHQLNSSRLWEARDQPCLFAGNRAVAQAHVLMLDAEGQRVQAMMHVDNRVLHVEPHNATHHHLFWRHTAVARELDARLRRSSEAGFCGLAQSRAPPESRDPQVLAARAAEGRWRRSSCTGKCTCPMLLMADHRYHQAMGGDVDVTVGLMIQALSDVDVIYRNSAFGGTTNYGLSVAEVRVYASPQAAGNPVAKSAYTADAFLEAYSTSAYGANVCLAHMFTNYDFSGILGLAWVGTDTGAGICDTRGYNTGFTTVSTFGSRVSSAVAQLVLAHE